jgi:hypothetical protein
VCPKEDGGEEEKKLVSTNGFFSITAEPKTVKKHV